MPYESGSDPALPAYIKKLAKAFRTAWVNAWNYAYKKFGSESKAFQYANGVIKKMKNKNVEAMDFEMHGTMGEIRQASDMTADELQSYGVNPSFPLYRPNCKIVTAKLVLADTPFCPEVEGMPEGLSYIIPKEALCGNLANIINMPVHITADLSAHSEKGDGATHYTSIGTVLGQKIVEEAGKVWGQVLMALWDEDHPEEVGKVSANKDKLGTSIEFMFNSADLEQADKSTFKIWDFIPKGLAILFKDKAAFPQTQLLVAQKSNANLQTSSNNKGDEMKKILIETDGTIESTKVVVNGVEIKILKEIALSIYAPDNSCAVPGNYLRLVEKIEEDDGFEVNKEYRLSANGVEEVKKEPTGAIKPKAQGGEKIMDYKGIKLEAENYTPEQVVGIIQSFEKSVEATEEQKKTLEAKDAKIAELQKRIEDFNKAEAERAKQEEVRKAEAKKAEARTTAEKWYEDNKDSYPEDQKETIVAIRTKVELCEAKPEEVLKLVELKRTGSSLPTGGNATSDPNKVKAEDNFYGIRDCRKRD
jgi:hypothetical protein